MSNPTGFVLPAATIGLDSLLVRPQRGFFPRQGNAVGPLQPIIAQATIEEVHHDELEITDHPVEQGATISDHAFKRPAELVIRCAWSNSPTKLQGLVGAAVGVAAAVFPPVGIAASIPGTINAVKAVNSLLTGNDSNQIKAIYQKLLQLQTLRVLCDIDTGKRSYKDMLFKSVSTTTDKDNENILLVTAVCRQVILVTTQTINVPINVNALANPKENLPTNLFGPAQLKGQPNNYIVPGFGGF